MPEITFFDGPEQPPQPRDQIRVEDLSLDPYPDGRRVKITMRLTPFGPTDRPNLNIIAQDKSGTEVASMSVIETLENHLSLTLHLRHTDVPTGTFTVSVALFYDPEHIQDTRAAMFALPANPE